MDLEIFYIGTCGGKDAKHRVSAGKIVQTIGKCIGIMGRANAIRPYNNPKNLVNPDSKPSCKYPPTKSKPFPKNSEIP
jgi:hypothetical protein